MQGLMEDLARLGRQWGLIRLELLRVQVQATVEREQRRVFDTLALLSLGLLLCTLGGAGLLLLLWTELPPAWRAPVMGLLLALIGAGGGALLSLARRRLVRD